MKPARLPPFAIGCTCESCRYRDEDFGGGHCSAPPDLAWCSNWEPAAAPTPELDAVVKLPRSMMIPTSGDDDS